jgi:hypothetical protein
MPVACRRAACWIPHKAAGCRFYSSCTGWDTRRLPPAARRLPPATPPKAAEREASASACGGRAVCWSAGEPGCRSRSGILPLCAQRDGGRGVRSQRGCGGVCLSPVACAACWIPHKAAGCRFYSSCTGWDTRRPPPAACDSAEGDGARSFSERLRRKGGKRGHGVEAASCRFVRKGTGDEGCGTRDLAPFDLPPEWAGFAG